MVDVFQKIVALAKRRGFFFPGSELYGGLANTYDYGPMGVELKRNIRNLWWETFVHQRDDMVGLESSLISHHRIWEASGHVGGFSDAMVDCRNCKSRFRVDHLIEEFLESLDESQLHEIVGNITKEDEAADSGKSEERFKKSLLERKVEGLSLKELDHVLRHLTQITCPKCHKHDWTSVKKFNLLFPVHVGIVVGDQDVAYLRGETAQGMFVDFKNVVDSTRVRLPFGIAQVGHSFRNEITPGNSIFRTLVFEQAEIEYFFNPEFHNWEELFEEWKNRMFSFVTERLGVKSENLRWREHGDKERSFYSTRTEDLEYNYPFGFKELWGLAYRTTYDLEQHQKYSGRDLSMVDPRNNKKVLPHVIEPAGGLDRMLLMVIADAYYEDEKRTVLKLSPQIAPFKVAVFPLLSNKSELVEQARGIYTSLKKKMNVVWDDRGNIGKRYLYQDEIGTPYCVTIDFQTLEDDSVTVRDRDTMEQVRVKIEDLDLYFQKHLLVSAIA